MYHDRAAWRCAIFVGKKKWKQRISTKKCCPCTVNIACHVRQSIIGCRSSRKRLTSIEDEHRAGRPVEIATPKTLQRVEDIIRAERRVTVGSVANAIGFSRGQAYNMIHFLLSRRLCGWKRSARVVPTATKRILRRRFPGTCETVGQVFKFVWRLCWKIKVVCMSLSPLYSFQSRFVTYLSNRPRIKSF